MEGESEQGLPHSNNLDSKYLAPLQFYPEEKNFLSEKDTNAQNTGCTQKTHVFLQTKNLLSPEEAGIGPEPFSGFLRVPVGSEDARYWTKLSDR